MAQTAGEQLVELLSKLHETSTNDHTYALTQNSISDDGVGHFVWAEAAKLAEQRVAAFAELKRMARSLVNELEAMQWDRQQAPPVCT